MIVTETFIKSVRYWIRNAMSKEAAYDYLNRLLKRRANVRDDVGDITFGFHFLPLTSSFKRRPLVDPRVVTLKYSHVRAIRRSVLQQRFLSFDDLSRFSGVYPPPTTTTPRHPTPQRPIRMAAWHIHSAQKDRTNSDKLCKKIDRKFYLPRRHKLNPCRKVVG